MQHLAIMKKSLGYLDKITDGTKTIESRWYISKRVPWDRIKKGETIYFKNSGDSVILKSKAGTILQFSDLTPKRIRDILNRYGRRMGIKDTNKFFKSIKNKRYCILIFLEDVSKITPFIIDKRGFGIMSAWIAVKNISQIKA